MFFLFFSSGQLLFQCFYFFFFEQCRLKESNSPEVFVGLVIVCHVRLLNSLNFENIHSLRPFIIFSPFLWISSNLAISFLKSAFLTFYYFYYSLKKCFPSPKLTYLNWIRNLFWTWHAISFYKHTTIVFFVFIFYLSKYLW